MSKRIELTNQQFGYWTVISYAGNSKWHCKCKCGTERDVAGTSLRKGVSTSCGCYRTANSRENNGKFINEIGNKYGLLTVIAKDEELSIQNHRAYWICQCDCGNYKTVSSKCLRKGKTTSCGCIGASRGEFKINTILTENKINFKIQYGVNIQGKWYRFDFAIFDKENNLQALIEYDGSQHSTNNQLHWGKPMEINIARDKIKNKYCQDNNIPLIRISYLDYEQINFQYILNKLNEKNITLSEI